LAGAAAFFTATQDGQTFFLLIAGDGSTLDVPAKGREVAAVLGGRGGGSGKLFQGKAAGLEGRTGALAVLGPQSYS